MTKELKQEFTLRITQANKTQLVTILYEMALLYIEEAKEALDVGDKSACKAAVRKIRGCMDELTASLHLEYELAQNLLQLYLFIDKELTQTTLHFQKENLDHVEFIVSRLKAAYKQIEEQDASGPVMGNAQTVYAGLTYGRNNLTENITNQAANRGFRV